MENILRHHDGKDSMIEMVLDFKLLTQQLEWVLEYDRTELLATCFHNKLKHLPKKHFDESCMFFSDVSSDHFYRPCRPRPSGWFHWHGRTLPMASGICEMIYLNDLPTTQRDSPPGWHYIHVFLFIYQFTNLPRMSFCGLIFQYF